MTWDSSTVNSISSPSILVTERDTDTEPEPWELVTIDKPVWSLEPVEPLAALTSSEEDQLQRVDREEDTIRPPNPDTVLQTRDPTTKLVSRPEERRVPTTTTRLPTSVLKRNWEEPPVTNLDLQTSQLLERALAEDTDTREECHRREELQREDQARATEASHLMERDQHLKKQHTEEDHPSHTRKLDKSPREPPMMTTLQ